MLLPAPVSYARRAFMAAMPGDMPPLEVVGQVDGVCQVFFFFFFMPCLPLVIIGLSFSHAFSLGQRTRKSLQFV